MFTSASPNPSAFQVIMTVLLFLLITAAVIAIVIEVKKKSQSDPRVSNSQVGEILGKRREFLDKQDPQLIGNKSFYNNLINSLGERERVLANLCPLTASVGGYIGPLENGVFDSKVFLRKAFEAGIRSFVLPISTYYDDNKKPPNWSLSGQPTIVCRDDAGKILSLNGLSLRTFCSDLLQFRGSNGAQSDEPVFLILKGVEGYIPDKVKSEEEYVRFMSNIARDLEILGNNRILTMKGYGPATGGVLEDKLLTEVDLGVFRNKILIFTDFDVYLGEKDAYRQKIQPRLWTTVNFLFKPYVSDTEEENKKARNAYSIRLEDISGSKINWSNRARNTWQMTLENSLTQTPSASLVDGATKTGIQCIPVPFFAVDSKGVKEIWDQWGGFSVRIKTPAARFTKPAPIVPMTPSAALNARVSPELQPGQLKIA